MIHQAITPVNDEATKVSKKRKKQENGSRNGQVRVFIFLAKISCPFGLFTSAVLLFSFLNFLLAGSHSLVRMHTPSAEPSKILTLCS